MSLRILFFHGFESTLPSKKAEWLKMNGHEVHAHPMQYSQSNAFDLALECAKKFEPDVIVGSSMGGYFALGVARRVPAKLVLLNPALHSRSKEYDCGKDGPHQPQVWALIGEKDSLISPQESLEILSGMNAHVQMGSHGHRTPTDVFSGYMQNIFDELTE